MLYTPHMIDISLKTIPHAEQRYPTAGDWRGDAAGQISVKVSSMGDWRYEFLVALHELIEGTLCNARGIKDAAVSAFDEAFEADREIAWGPGTLIPGIASYGEDDRSEPGDDPRAPYRREHFTATNIERLIAAELGVDWGEYERAIGAL